MGLKRLTLAVLPLLAGVAHADSLMTDAPDQGFAGAASAGLVKTTGNTETETVNADFDLKWRLSEPFAMGLEIGAFRDSSENEAGEDETTAERYWARWNTRYNLSEKSFLFSNIDYERDRFSGYEYQATAFGGYGYQFIDNAINSLAMGAGLGYRVSKTEELGEHENEVVLRGTLNFRHAFSETSEFTQLVVADIGQEYDIYRSESIITANIVGNLALKAGILVKHTTEVPVGNEKTDTITTVGLQYKF